MERYEQFREHGWKSLPEGSAKVISYFLKRKPKDIPVTVPQVYVQPQELNTEYDRCYEVSLVVRLMRDKMMTRKITSTSKGTKKRLTPRKDFLDMKRYDVYTWVSLIEEVRYCVINNEETILLCKKEVDIIS